MDQSRQEAENSKVQRTGHSWTQAMDPRTVGNDGDMYLMDLDDKELHALEQLD